MISSDFALHEIDFKLPSRYRLYSLLYMSRFITKYSLLSGLQTELEEDFKKCVNLRSEDNVTWSSVHQSSHRLQSTGLGL